MCAAACFLGRREAGAELQPADLKVRSQDGTFRQCLTLAVTWLCSAGQDDQNSISGRAEHTWINCHLRKGPSLSAQEVSFSGASLDCSEGFQRRALQVGSLRQQRRVKGSATHVDE